MDFRIWSRKDIRAERNSVNKRARGHTWGQYTTSENLSYKTRPADEKSGFVLWKKTLYFSSRVHARGQDAEGPEGRLEHYAVAYSPRIEWDSTVSLLGQIASKACRGEGIVSVGMNEWAITNFDSTNDVYAVPWPEDGTRIWLAKEVWPAIVRPIAWTSIGYIAIVCRKRRSSEDRPRGLQYYDKSYLRKQVLIRLKRAWCWLEPLRHHSI